MTILDKINQLLAREGSTCTNAKPTDSSDDDKQKVWYSYEYFPPKTVAGK